MLISTMVMQSWIECHWFDCFCSAEQCLSGMLDLMSMRKWVRYWIWFAAPGRQSTVWKISFEMFNCCCFVKDSGSAISPLEFHRISIHIALECIHIVAMGKVNNLMRKCYSLLMSEATKSLFIFWSKCKCSVEKLLLFVSNVNIRNIHFTSPHTNLTHSTVYINDSINVN